MQIAIVNAHHDPALVVVSFVIAVLASYTTLDLTNSLLLARGRAQSVWLAVGSLAMGTGIWSMHFTGMLAFQLEQRTISYEIRLLVASIVIAIMASMLALFIFTRSRINRSMLVFAGCSMGVAIAGMHYTGMAAMRTAAAIDWNGWLVVLSIAIAVTASFVGLDIARRLRDERHPPALLKTIGALLFGFAIAGMHYTAMAAATFRPATIARTDEKYIVATDGLALAVTSFPIMILVVATGASVVTRTIARRSAQLRREQELAARVRESEQYYRALIENASDLIVVIDKDTNRKYVSPSYERILGYAPEELLGRSAFDLLHPDEIPEVQAIFQEFVQQHGSQRHVVLRVRHKDGSWRTLNLIASNLLHDPAVNGIVMTAQDETERRRLEMQFQQSQKMEAVGKLAGGIAHDFNNLLTVIIGNVSIMLDESASLRVHETLTETHDAAQRAARLTRQLLAFSRRQVLQPSVLQLNDVVRGMHNIIVRLLSEDIKVEIVLQPELWPIRADAGQVEQALLNLAVNARDAMPNGGVLRLATFEKTYAGEIVSVHDRIPAGSYVCLEVTDTGTGIEPDVMPRIFEPFFTTKDVGHGTGLGLATLYGIMKQSGGFVAVRSEPGVGSRFRLLFPAQRDAKVEPSRATADTHDGTATATILLIEDETGVRALAKRALEKVGYRVLDAAAGRSAVAMARQYPGQIDLVVSDVVLPDINGREAADQIRTLHPETRVLFMSGYTEDEVIHRGVFSNGVNFLQKPFAPQDLVGKVRAVLDD